VREPRHPAPSKVMLERIYACRELDAGAVMEPTPAPCRFRRRWPSSRLSSWRREQHWNRRFRELSAGLAAIRRGVELVLARRAPALTGPLSGSHPSWSRQGGARALLRIARAGARRGRDRAGGVKGCAYARPP
jgi:hypothetical protein